MSLAKKERLTKSEVIRKAIKMLVNQQKEGSGAARRPYDAVADVIGCVRGGPSDLSIHTGEKFRQILHGKIERSR